MAEGRTDPKIVAALENFETGIDYHFEEAWSAVARDDRARLLLELQEAEDAFRDFRSRVLRRHSPFEDFGDAEEAAG